ncbi:hypothetical protein ACIQ6Y_20490 [Streptomyces sp. NPDC096205]|uniref:hypothetical protein n=1 Tax=Streptomyces sp. NPDC096205 TaxID=3366081 RepID=UPI003826E55B
MPEAPHDAAHDDRGQAPVSAVRRLASRLRRAHRRGPATAAPPADTPPADPPSADPPPADPPSGLRPQSEGDASVYPLF